MSGEEKILAWGTLLPESVLDLSGHGSGPFVRRFTSGAPKTVQVTIPSGQDTSAAVDLGAGYRLDRIITPSGMSGDAFSFLFATAIDGTYADHYRDGAVYTEAMGSSRDIGVDASKFLTARFMKLKAITIATGAGAAQGADKPLTLVLMPV